MWFEMKNSQDDWIENNSQCVIVISPADVGYTVLLTLHSCTMFLRNRKTCLIDRRERSSPGNLRPGTRPIGAGPHWPAAYGLGSSAFDFGACHNQSTTVVPFRRLELYFWLFTKCHFVCWQWLYFRHKRQSAFTFPEGSANPLLCDAKPNYYCCSEAEVNVVLCCSGGIREL